MKYPNTECKICDGTGLIPSIFAHYANTDTTKLPERDRNCRICKGDGFIKNLRVHALGLREMKTNGKVTLQQQGHIIEGRVNGGDWTYITCTHPDSVESVIKHLEKDDNET
jgi:hypothetical protein